MIFTHLPSQIFRALVAVPSDRNLFSVSFAGSGCLKILYDLGLLAFFEEKGKRREGKGESRTIEDPERRRGSGWSD
ncbi:hypothetical protein F4818DRAFT_409294 [Hypoxylon cercidicola]|nr:hypothetical protein F4818DRAFT_409294 [Hypoxylon cercidicola]